MGKAWELSAGVSALRFERAFPGVGAEQTNLLAGAGDDRIAAVEVVVGSHERNADLVARYPPRAAVLPFQVFVPVRPTLYPRIGDGANGTVRPEGPDLILEAAKGARVAAEFAIVDALRKLGGAERIGLGEGGRRCGGDAGGTERDQHGLAHVDVPFF